MGINKDFFVPQTTVHWDGHEVCTVRGLTPNDITQAMSENAADMEVLMEAFEKDAVLSKVDVSKDRELQTAMNDNMTKMFTTLMAQVPNLAAKLIALACDEPEAWEFVKSKYVLPLQFNILTAVAKLTFVDTNGFKDFLGNVMALVGDVSGQRQAKNPNSTQTLSRPDTAG